MSKVAISGTAFNHLPSGAIRFVGLYQEVFNVACELEELLDIPNNTVAPEIG